MFNPYRNYRTLRRYQQIILTVVRFGFGELVGRLKLFQYLKLKRQTAEELDRNQVSRAVRFRLMLEQLGPTFIKLGQILSTRPDMLPADIVAELANLQDQVTPLPWKDVEGALPRDFLEGFAELEREPLACASLAQVYKGRLRSGETVAVKMIRPGSERVIRDDIMILEHMAALAETHIPEARHWNTRSIIEQFRHTVKQELDLHHEGRNADLFRKNFADDPGVYVPKIYWEHSHTNVLVMEYIDGQPLSEFFSEETPRARRRELARRGVDAVLKQIFTFGFFHADPHPGNVFVLNENVICFLDFGMFGRLDEGLLGILSRVLRAGVEKDIDRLFKAVRDLGVIPDQVNMPQLRGEVLDFLEQYHGIPLKQVNVRQLLGDIVSLVNRHHLGVRHDFLLLIKALGTAEGIGSRLDGDFEMLPQVEPFVRKLFLERFSVRRRVGEAQMAAEDLVLLARESPEHLLEILRKVRAGKLKLEFHHTGLEEPFAQLNQMSDKVTLGLIIGAIIIASALMAHVGLGPKLFDIPIIGGVGFLIAFVAGVWITIDILRSRK